MREHIVGESSSVSVYEEVEGPAFVLRDRYRTVSVREDTQCGPVSHRIFVGRHLFAQSIVSTGN